MARLKVKARQGSLARQLRNAQETCSTGAEGSRVSPATAVTNAEFTRPILEGSLSLAEFCTAVMECSLSPSNLVTTIGSDPPFNSQERSILPTQTPPHTWERTSPVNMRASGLFVLHLGSSPQASLMSRDPPNYVVDCRELKARLQGHINRRQRSKSGVMRPLEDPHLLRSSSTEIRRGRQVLGSVRGGCVGKESVHAPLPPYQLPEGREPTAIGGIQRSPVVLRSRITRSSCLLQTLGGREACEDITSIGDGGSGRRLPTPGMLRRELVDATAVGANEVEDMGVCNPTSSRPISLTRRALFSDPTHGSGGSSSNPQQELLDSSDEDFDSSDEDPDWAQDFLMLNSAGGEGGSSTESSTPSCAEDPLLELGMYDPHEDITGWPFENLYANDQWQDQHTTLLQNTADLFGPTPRPTSLPATREVDYFMRYWPADILFRVVDETNRCETTALERVSVSNRQAVQPVQELYQGLGACVAGERLHMDIPMHTHSTTKFGVVETISFVAAAAGLLANAQKLYDKFSDVRSTKKGEVRLLVDQVKFLIGDYQLLNRPAPSTVVEVLKRLDRKAEKLLKSVSYGLPHRVVSAIAHGKFVTRLGELRTGIADIRNTLQQLASSVSPYQASPATSQQHLASAPAPYSSSIPAPGGTFIQVNIINHQPCPIHFNMDPAQAPGVMKAPPSGYPPVGYPAIYGYPAV